MLALCYLLAKDGYRRTTTRDISPQDIAIENNWQDYLQNSLEKPKN